MNEDNAEKIVFWVNEESLKVYRHSNSSLL